jgi:hypothetical protein
MKKLISLSLTFLLLTICSNALAQEESEEKDRDLRIELEPSSFFLRGIAGSVSYNLTKDNNLNMGLYAVTSDVPSFLKTSMFNNVYDTTDVRLGFQLALVTRYRLKLFKEWESNPYVGLIAGWEYFDIQQPSDPNPVRITTFIATPYAGYEFYFFKKMLYVNPQVRGVIYLGTESDAPTRPESLKAAWILPQISLGVRL